MDLRRIGSLEVTVLGLGCNQFGRKIDAAQSARVVDAALDEGISFFETADTYARGASEEFLGRALRGHRDRAVIATKVGQKREGGQRVDGGGKAEYLIASVEESLKRLETDCVDLLMFHWPDPTTPIEETLGAFDQIVREGKAREIGCSNFSAAQLIEADEIAEKNSLKKFASATNQYSLFVRDSETDVIPECELRGKAFLPWFPLFHGMLTGKYRRDEPAPAGSRLSEFPDWRNDAWTDHNFAILESLTDYAADHGRSVLELAFAWLLAIPPISSVIAGVTSPEQVRGNAASISWSLTSDEVDEISRLSNSAG
jgi:aryl-alcohol dehydrogenase-like predicted oxidoreductase